MKVMGLGGIERGKRGLKRKTEGFLGIVAFPSEGALFFFPEWKRFSSKEKNTGWGRKSFTHKLCGRGSFKSLGALKGGDQCQRKTIMKSFL